MVIGAAEYNIVAFLENQPTAEAPQEPAKAKGKEYQASAQASSVIEQSRTYRIVAIIFMTGIAIGLLMGRFCI
jgi:hypothetical protein